jgi:hypothetical protein
MPLATFAIPLVGRAGAAFKPEALLRVASDNYEPASGWGFAVPDVIVGVGVGRLKKA